GRPGAGAARSHPGRRLADDAVRGAAVLRPAGDHPARGLRGGAGGRRRALGHAGLGHAAPAPLHPVSGAAVPHARRAARLRPHVRADRWRSRQQDGDADGLRLSQPVPDAAAGLRLGHRRGDLRARDGGGRRLSASAAPGGAGRVKARRRAWDVAVLLLLAVWATPFFWQVRTSFTPDSELLAFSGALPARPTLIHYRAVVERSVMPQALGNSLGVAILTTLLALAIGLPAAYGVARLPVPGKSLLLLAVVASTAFPQITTVSPLYLLMRALGLRDTWTALVLANTSFALPLLIWLLAGFIREIPVELEEAAFLDGAGRLGALRRVVLPIVAPGAASAALLTFLASWNEFLFAYTFTATEASRTVPVALALFPGIFEVPWGDIAAASILASLPPILLVAVLQRYLIRGLLAGALRE